MKLTMLLTQVPTRSVWAVASGEELVLLLMAVGLLIGSVLVGAVAVYLLLILRKALAPAPVKPVETRTLWQRVSGLRPMSQEKDLVMEHAYDGIAELDNPTPPWFMGLFYTTIAFGVVYLFIFHVIGPGDVMVSEYTQEMAIAEKQRDEYIKQVAGSINENTVVQLTDAKAIDAGKVLFGQYCTACHGASAEGKVGPNLTDEYWLHGGQVKAVFHTITEGVPEKGMISWKKQLNPLQIQQVASYVLSLQGSKPAGAKEPQGEKEPTGPTVALTN